MSTAQSAAGRVAIVGAGPGDPGLITLNGVRALEAADIVFYDALASAELLHHSPSAELIYVGKRAGSHAMTQDEINARLVAAAREGRCVVRLKGGDPFVFGRGSEEALACREAGVPFEIVPGITSAIAAPAYAGIPVTHRGMASSFTVITASDAGEESAETWEAAAGAGTLIILMGASRLEQVMQRLVTLGRSGDTPAACIRWGTRADQQVVAGTIGTLADRVREAHLGPPVVTVVGEVAAFAGRLAWFEPGRLAGKRIVVTRARAQASGLSETLRAMGALTIEAPVIGIELHGERLPLHEGAGTRWDWIVFTSANGVDAFFAALHALEMDARTLGTTQIASIGDATTAALRRSGIRPDFEPSRATSDVLAVELPRVSGARILLPVSSLTDSRLSDGLRKRGAHIEQVAAYDNRSEPLDEQQLRELAEAHAITFTSASTARNLKVALDGGSPDSATKLLSIGPETSKAVMQAFGRLDGEARDPSLASLVELVVETLCE